LQAAGVALVAAALAGAGEVDRLVVALETAGHLPGALEATTESTESIPLGATAPAVHEITAAYGIAVRELASELLLRVGYGWADGALAAGSVIGNAPGERYAVRAVPLSVGWRATFLPYRVRPLVGVDAGGRFLDVEYRRTGAAPVASGWSFVLGLRGLVGLHADVTKMLAARLFFEARWSRDAQVDGAPDLDLSGFGAGLAVVATFDRPELAPPGPVSDDEAPALRDYGDAGPSRLSQASEVIRQADDAARARRFIEAEALYRKGVSLLPRDPETRRNLEAPVLVDWARTLVEIGRSEEAKRVVEQALEIDPRLESAQKLLDRILYP
jgi:tetratricopeptide (TPR) repeat protein